MIRSVIQVLPKNDFKVYVYFDDGKIKLFDMSHLIGKGVFLKISSREDFMEKCTVLNGTLAWDLDGKFDGSNCIDIAPEAIYENGKDVRDPLAYNVAS